MADVIRYAHPAEQFVYTMDFQDVLPSADATLLDIGLGSTIDAVNSAKVAVTDILKSKTRTTKTLKVTFQLLAEGEEYTVTFLGQGTTSGERFPKTLRLIVRRDLTGEF